MNRSGVLGAKEHLNSERLKLRFLLSSPYACRLDNSIFNPGPWLDESETLLM
jgi:hypothetical protein